MDEDGCTAAHKAAGLGFEHVLVALLRGGAAVDCRDHRDRTPLHLAASRGALACVDCLLR